MLFVVIFPLVLIIAVYIILKLIVFMPAISGENAIVSLETVEIGGIDQKMLIRGEDTANPILLYLHSGPGSTEMVSFRTYHRELEKHFTVVLWEQRGTGKSYDPSIPNTSMTIDTMVSDTGEVIQYLLNKFNQKKLFVAGHSWGSLLGILTVQKYPEYIYAYVGCGQEVNPVEGEEISYQYALDAANARNDAQAVKELEGINSSYAYLDVESNSDWYDDLMAERKWLDKYGGETYKQGNSFLILPSLLPSEYTLGDFIRFGQGVKFSLKALWPQIMQVNLIESANSLSVPVFFLQGRHDFNTPSSLVEDYFNALQAPQKEFIWFENSAHHPMYEEAEKYDQVLINKLLPLAQITPTSTEYSYADLKAVQNDIDDYFESFDEEGARNDKICQVTNRVSIVDGYVEVNLKEITDDIIKLFKERVSDSDAIKFKQGPPGHEDSDQK